MLSAGGLFTGGLVWYAWERVWIWRRLDLGEFAVDFRRSVRRADPAMPILLMTCGAAAGVFASSTPPGRQERLLQHVLHIGGRQHRTQPSSQPRRVPREQLPQRRVVPCGHGSDQLIVVHRLLCCAPAAKGSPNRADFLLSHHSRVDHGPSGGASRAASRRFLHETLRGVLARHSIES
jgi:hypothetical protein